MSHPECILFGCGPAVLRVLCFLAATTTMLTDDRPLLALWF